MTPRFANKEWSKSVAKTINQEYYITSWMVKPLLVLLVVYLACLLDLVSFHQLKFGSGCVFSVRGKLKRSMIQYMPSSCSLSKPFILPPQRA